MSAKSLADAGSPAAAAGTIRRYVFRVLTGAANRTRSRGRASSRGRARPIELAGISSLIESSDPQLYLTGGAGKARTVTAGTAGALPSGKIASSPEEVT